MKLTKRLERLVKAVALAPAVLLQHGSLRPSRVRIAATGGYIHIDPKDRRAIKKLVHDTVRRRISAPMRFWRDFLGKMQPHFAVDVGVNYGECLFGTRYGQNTQVIGCEANPRIIPFVLKSQAAHPDAARIKVVHALISDEESRTEKFYVDPDWSGTATVVAPDPKDAASMEVCQLLTRRLDHIITPAEAAGRSLLFKMDIEGSEPRAMAGFEPSLVAARLAVGFMEYDTTFIRCAGADPAAFYDRLAKLFSVYRLVGEKSSQLIQVHALSEIPSSRASDSRIHTDLILVTKGALTETWLPSGWTIQSVP